MSKIAVVSISSFCFLLFSACVKDSAKLLTSQMPAVSACDTITYTKHIKPVFDASCISCHGSSPLPGAPMLTTYDQVKVYAANGEIKSYVIDGTPELMPQGGPALPADQKNLILCWLGNGMKQ
jgi:hypothetical protein